MRRLRDVHRLIQYKAQKQDRGDKTLSSDYGNSSVLFECLMVDRFSQVLLIRAVIFIFLFSDISSMIGILNEANTFFIYFEFIYYFFAIVIHIIFSLFIHKIKNVTLM